MGTRADFYIKQDERLVWLGSIAWDGDEIPEEVEQAKTPETYLSAVSKFLAERDDATLPEQGWPWPWDTSETTDCAYAFIDDCVCEAINTKYDYPAWYPIRTQRHVEEFKWPDMSDRKAVTMGKRSGLIVLGGI